MKTIRSILPLIALNLLGLPAAATAAITPPNTGSPHGDESAPAPGKPSAELKQSEAAHWIDALGGKDYTPTFPRDDAAAPLRPQQPDKTGMFHFHDDEAAFTLKFRDRPDLAAPVDKIRDSFEYIALLNIPVPGVSSPDWRVKLLTPTSALREGVEIESWNQGILKLRIRTTFFAVSGTDRAFIRSWPADKKLPSTAYFQLRRPVKSEIRMTLDLNETAAPGGESDGRR